MKPKSVQIREIRSRSGRDVDSLIEDLQTMEARWRASDGNLDCYSEFIPIKIINVIETTYKLAVRNLVNNHPECLERSIEFINKVGKKDVFSILSEIEMQSFTIGDVIKYVAPFGSMRDMAEFLTKILGADFKVELGNTGEMWVEDDASRGPIIEDIDGTFQQIDSIFELRHILVHENPGNDFLDSKSIPAMFSHAIPFVSALDWLTSNFLHGPRARTAREKSRIQSEMFKAKFASVASRLNYEHISAVSTGNPDPIKEVLTLIERTKGGVGGRTRHISEMSEADFEREHRFASKMIDWYVSEVSAWEADISDSRHKGSSVR